MESGRRTGALLSGIRGLAAVLALVVPVLAAAMCVTVETEDPAGVVVSLYLEPRGTFSLQFINSIYLAPVKETYRYVPTEGITAILVESPSAAVFEYYGIVPDGSGAAAVNTRAPEIRVRSHDYRNHRLSTDTETISLKGLVPDGDPLVIRVREGSVCRCRPKGPGGAR